MNFQLGLRIKQLHDRGIIITTTGRYPPLPAEGRHMCKMFAAKDHIPQVFDHLIFEKRGLNSTIFKKRGLNSNKNVFLVSFNAVHSKLFIFDGISPQNFSDGQ